MYTEDLDFNALLDQATERANELNEFLASPVAAEVDAETRDFYQRYADTLNGQVIVLKELCEFVSMEVVDEIPTYTGAYDNIED